MFGPSVFGGTSTGVFGANSSPLGSMSAFSATSSPAFGSSTAALRAPLAPAFGSSLLSFGVWSLLFWKTSGSSLFGQKPAFGGFASRPNQSDSSGSVFQQTQTTFGSNPFGSSTPFDASTQNAFGAGSTPAFGAASTSTFAVASTPTFGSSSTSIFGSTGTAFAVSSAPAFGFGTGAAFGASNTSGTLSTSILGASNTSAFGASSSPAFGTSSTTGFGFGTTPTYGQSTSASGSSSIFEAAPSLFGTQSSYFGAQTTMPTFGTTSFGPSAFGGQRGGSRVAAYTAAAEVDELRGSSSSPVLGPSPSIFSSTSALGTASGIGSGLSSANTQSSPAFRSSTQSTVVGQPAPVVSPFGALPAMPQLSIAHPGSTPSIRYGISSMPVFDKPAAPVRLSSLLTSRHLSQRRIRFPARKYDPKSDGPKVPFFSNDGEMPTAPKAGTLFVPRENPRALVINPAEQWPQRPNNENMSPLLRASYVHIYNNGSVSENSADKEGTSSIKSNHKPNDPCNITFTEKEALHIITSTGCKAGEAAILQEQETDVEALMPRLQRSGYYTEPQIHELAVKERAEPGFCCRVKNFVVGRHGYGNIKFLGDTDVRKLDLDSHIHFDNRKLTVYMDESKKPPVGQGLNKLAEVTLLNIKCIDRETVHKWT
ncbi:unnamed protein product [Camellia sinensis]